MRALTFPCIYVNLFFSSVIAALLQFFRKRSTPANILQNFFVIGGECNYLFIVKEDYRLHSVRYTLVHAPARTCTPFRLNLALHPFSLLSSLILSEYFQIDQF